jgi:predicted secreted protein
MSTGALLYPVGYIFLDDSGVPVNAGLVYFFRTGTSTEQDTYSDSTLDTANANPVVLNASGRATTAIYGNPSSGYRYRVRLTTSAGSQIWYYDDVVVDAADSATYSEGSFTGTATGMSGATTGTINYRIVANSAGTGKLVTLYTEASITGTSNTTALTITGLPAVCTPAVNRQSSLIVAIDNGNAVQAMAAIGTDGTLTLYTDEPLSATGWTNSGVKGLAVCTIAYSL